MLKSNIYNVFRHMSFFVYYSLSLVMKIGLIDTAYTFKLLGEQVVSMCQPVLLAGCHRMTREVWNPSQYKT